MVMLRFYYWLFNEELHLVGLDMGCWRLNPVGHMQGRHPTHCTIPPAPHYFTLEDVKESGNSIVNNFAIVKKITIDNHSI